MHTIGRAPRGQPRASTTTALAWAIWGNATNDVWAAECSVGYLGHYDGTGWNHLNSQDGGPAIWGSGTSDVWLIDLIGGNRACDSAPSSSSIGKAPAACPETLSSRSPTRCPRRDDRTTPRPSTLCLSL